MAVNYGKCIQEERMASIDLVELDNTYLNDNTNLILQALINSLKKWG